MLTVFLHFLLNIVTKMNGKEVVLRFSCYNEYKIKMEKVDELSITPIGEKERIAVVDILRGISILGIFLVNMPSFYSPMLYINPYTYYKGTWNEVFYRIIDFLAQASFYPLFAFLFGYGAVILEKRLTEKGMSFPKVYSRRLIVLLVIGIIHAFLIWHGDILINYALFGFFYLLFYKISGKSLLWIGMLMYMIPFSLLAILFTVLSLVGWDSGDWMTDAVKIKQSLEVYGDGSFLEITAQRFEDWYTVNNFVSLMLLFLSIFPLFLIGAGFAKLKWLEQPQIHSKPLKLLFWITLPAGVLLKLSPYYLEGYGASSLIQDQLGGPMLSIAYITGVTLFLRNKLARRTFISFSYVGRLSLSNYLFQSILCTLIFYSYGLGLYGKISFTTGCVMVVIIYTLQLWMSKAWLAKYKIGPVEYLWRWLTYGTRPKLRSM
ncbi:DUF418 domain-containing protein [Peribacillus tepidiphilus]|uniref:DUF418 domain-containing protein n=1 Tax=Peribacillus tepidiphilus TaxID=2652445 RepID=UPI001CDB6C91|nr:DUF418 domain-containing protein [Peribacillus tepidiphilus]